VKENNMSLEEHKSFVALGYTLFFIRLHLFCANGNNVPSETRIFGLSCSAIWFTSLMGIAKITKKNIVLETIGMVFLVSRNEVCHPRKLMTEPVEHHFGDTRSDKREFTVLEYNGTSEKVQRASMAIAKGDLVNTRDPKKGYCATALDYHASVSKPINTSKEISVTPGNVIIDYNCGISVAEQIWADGSLQTCI